MHRRKPASAKQRKAQLQQKRAVKRGDISPPPPPSKQDRRRKGPSNADPANAALVASARRLQSAFVKLPQEFLERTKSVAAALPLQRPVPLQAALLLDPADTLSDPSDAKSEGDPCSELSPTASVTNVTLTCPKRPKWRYDMTKEMVEKNEEALFKKWLDQTDDAVDVWCEQKNARVTDKGTGTEETMVMPPAPTSFERNIEVWRQLWRVTEISQILLILLDSRCPLLHYPPSLSAYLTNPFTARRTRIILVLTKVDIAGPARADAWTRFLKQKYPNLRIVQVESYTEKDSGIGSGKKKVYEPHLPTAFRQALVEALKETHAEFLEPPDRIKNDSEKSKNWKPRVKRNIDWEAVLNARGGQVGMVVGGATMPKVIDPLPGGEDDGDEEKEGERTEPEVLTIGLIGQPNVGKSSLLNALFGTTKVRASRTPGKTKHFQTLFWTSQVRLVDCPGLVIPNYTPMETQVLSGILPISRVSAVSLCIYHAAKLLPLERIYGLEHPSLAEGSQRREDKRTWREDKRKEKEEEKKEEIKERGEKGVVWTAMDVLVAFALKKGWVTAKAGRPDINRAGNYILRALAEGRIRWGFWPPDTDLSLIETNQGVEGCGIWIHSLDGVENYDWEVESEYESDDGNHRAQESEDEHEDRVGDEGEDGEEESEEEEEGPKAVAATSAGRFGALRLNENAESDNDDSDSDDS
ncbi:hypothetical protein QCA50_016359 [Cerrena zonata]|uniref:Guanine nucleotide-binding protein-like 1 n=1 Tax=Cerrena zonata TaxID=2478898 RepID=A0AAW0FTF2_9APHY